MLDLTRQNKMMQSKLDLEIQIVEQTVNTLRSQLGMVSVSFNGNYEFIHQHNQGNFDPADYGQ